MEVLTFSKTSMVTKQRTQQQKQKKKKVPSSQRSEVFKMTEPAELEYYVLQATGKTHKDFLKPRRVTKGLQDGKGWISEPNCQFPVEIILKFETRCKVSKMQILIHHQFIPQTIDFFYADEDEDMLEYLEMDDLDFEKLGTASFQDNKSTEFQARELKTIFMNVDALFVKMLIHDSYPNKFNSDNQVGIMDLDFHGVAMGETKQKKKHHKHMVNSDMARRISRCETAKRLGTAQARKLLERNCTQETARLLKVLETKLEIAKGKKEPCKKLETAVLQITKLKSELELMLKEQRKAFGQNDDEFADACESAMNEHVQSVYKDIDVHSLLTDKEKDEVGLVKKKTSKTGKGRPSRSIGDVHRDARRESVAPLSHSASGTQLKASKPNRSSSRTTKPEPKKSVNRSRSEVNSRKI